MPRGSSPCPPECGCGKHARRGVQDSVEVRARKSEAAAAAWAKRTDHTTHMKAASKARRDLGLDTFQALSLRLERTAEFKEWINRMHGATPPARYVDEPVSGLDEHKELAERLGIRMLTRATLRRYGLTELEWLELAAAQGWMCPICLRRVHKLVTDHEHTPNWKHLPPGERKRFVRGLLCVFCNFQVVPSRMTAAEAAHMAEYLHAYEVRRDA